MRAETTEADTKHPCPASSPDRLPSPVGGDTPQPFEWAELESRQPWCRPCQLQRPDSNDEAEEEGSVELTLIEQDSKDNDAEDSSRHRPIDLRLPGALHDFEPVQGHTDQHHAERSKEEVADQEYAGSITN